MLTQQFLCFYIDISTFEESQSVAFWQGEFNPTPSSSIILGIFCQDENIEPDSWQFTTAQKIGLKV